MALWKRLLRGLFGIACVWLILGFFVLDWNVFGWSAPGRFFLTAFGLIAAALAQVTRADLIKLMEA